MAVVGRPGGRHGRHRLRQAGGVLTGQDHVEVEDLARGGRPQVLGPGGEGGHRLGQGDPALRRRRPAGRRGGEHPGTEHPGTEHPGTERRRGERPGEPRALPMTPVHESASLLWLVPPAPSASRGVGS